MNKFLKLFTDPDRTVLVSSEPYSVPCAKTFDPNYIYFCQRNVPVTDATKHLALFGTTSAGKSINNKLLLASIAKREFRSRSPFKRLVIFDAKCDVVPYLASLGLHPDDEDVWIIQPFDSRGSVWSVSEFVRTPATALYIAWIIVPEERNSTAPFFTDAARLLVYAVTLGFIARAPKPWSFRDLLCALASRETISYIASFSPEGASIAGSILNDERHSSGVIASIATKVRKFSQIAALWENQKNPKRFSLDQFMEKGGVLILGNDPVLRNSINPILMLILRTLTDRILQGPEVLYPNTLFNLDEFLWLAAHDKDNCLVELMEMGRSKGASVFMGIQSIAGLIDIYGEAKANRLLSLCAHKMFLRVGDPQTAEWAERYFGKVRQTEATISESWNKDGTSFTAQFSTQERSMFLASTFMNIPFPGPGNDICSISDVPSANAAILSTRSFDETQSWLPKPVDVPAIVRRDDPEEQILRPWSEEEGRGYFNAKETPAEEPQEPPTKPATAYLPPRNKPDDPEQGKLF